MAVPDFQKYPYPPGGTPSHWGPHSTPNLFFQKFFSYPRGGLLPWPASVAWCFLPCWTSSLLPWSRPAPSLPAPHVLACPRMCPRVQICVCVCVCVCRCRRGAAPFLRPAPSCVEASVELSETSVQMSAILPGFLPSGPGDSIMAARSMPSRWGCREQSDCLKTPPPGIYFEFDRFSAQKRLF